MSPNPYSLDDADPFGYARRRMKALSPSIPPAAINSSGASQGFSTDDPGDDSPWYGPKLDRAANRVSDYPSLTASGPSGNGQTAQPQAKLADGDLSAGAGNVLGGGKKMPPPGTSAPSASDDPGAAGVAPEQPQAQLPPGVTPQMKAIQDRQQQLVNNPPRMIGSRPQDQTPVIDSATGQPQIDPATGKPVTKEKTGAKVASWGQRLAMAILSAGKLAPYAQQIVHPDYTQQVEAASAEQKGLQGELANQEKIENIGYLGESREAIAAQKKAQADNYAAENQRKAEADQAAEQIKQHNEFTRQLGKPEDLIENLQPGDPRIPQLQAQGWQVLDDIRYPAGSGVKVARPPSSVQVTPDNIGILTGRKVGDLVPLSEWKSSLAEYQKQEAAANKAGAVPPKTDVRQMQVGGKPHQVLFNATTGETIKDLGESGEKPPVGGATNINMINPAALDQAAELYATTGAMPSVGFGKDAATMRSQIMNRAAELHPDARLADAKTDYGANKGAITSLARQQSQVLTFEDTAAKNLDLADQISQKVDRTGSPVMNRFLLHMKGQYAGDTDTQLLNNAVETAANEYAKVISGATSGGTTDSAREHARTMLSSAMGNGTFSQAIALMKQEMGNRRAGYDDQMKELKSGRKGQSPAPAAAAPSQPIKVQHSPSTGLTRYSTDGGKTWVQGQPPVQK